MTRYGENDENKVFAISNGQAKDSHCNHEESIVILVKIMVMMMMIVMMVIMMIMIIHFARVIVL